MAGEKGIKRTTKRKAKVFLVLLLCSFLAWLISKLSEMHTDRITYDLVFENSPDTLLLLGTSKESVSLLVRATGWQFLGSKFSSTKLPLDLSASSFNGGRYFISDQVYRKQIENKLSGSLSILQIDQDTLFLNFTKIIKRKVPIRAQVSLELSQNYMLDGQLVLAPDSIVLRGPSREVDTIHFITTETMSLTDISEDFERSLLIRKSPALEYTEYDHEKVKVTGKVFRFSEKIFEVPVTVINLPEGTQIRTFPNVISVLCKARLEQLKELKPADFTIIADHNQVKEGSAFLPLELIKKPDSISSVQLMESQIEFILKRE
jgi:hypothetical protein